MYFGRPDHASFMLCPIDIPVVVGKMSQVFPDFTENLHAQKPNKAQIN